MAKARSIGIALLGFGTVGQGVVDILRRRASEFSDRLSVPMEIRRVLVRTLAKHRDIEIPESQLTLRIDDILNDPSIDIVVELMGGLSPAVEWIEAALKAGKHVITANKAVLARSGESILKRAAAADRTLLFEAAVAGGIPLIRAIRGGLSADRLTALYGIINGTSNYILSEMARTGAEFARVLETAQRLGYAEQDPSFDVDGVDAAHKLAILIRLCYGLDVSVDDFAVEGIRDIDREDICFARDFGYAIRSLAIAKRVPDASPTTITARVEPVLIPLESILAKVEGAYNAAYLCGDDVGDVMLYGAGAGRYPTASAVVSDILELSERLVRGEAGYRSPYGYATLTRATVEPIDARSGAYYLRFTVLDRPHVLETITKILAERGISLSSVYQPARHVPDAAPIAMITHRTRESDLRSALAEIDACDFLVHKSRRIPVEPLVFE